MHGSIAWHCGCFSSLTYAGCLHASIYVDLGYQRVRMCLFDSSTLLVEIINGATEVICVYVQASISVELVIFWVNIGQCRCVCLQAPNLSNSDCYSTK